MGVSGDDLMGNDTIWDVLNGILRHTQDPVVHILKTIDKYSNPNYDGYILGYIFSDEANKILMYSLVIIGFWDINLIKNKKDVWLDKGQIKGIEKCIRMYQPDFDSCMDDSYYFKAEKLLAIVVDRENSEALDLWEGWSHKLYRGWMKGADEIANDMKTICSQLSDR